MSEAIQKSLVSCTENDAMRWALRFWYVQAFYLKEGGLNDGFQMFEEGIIIKILKFWQTTRLQEELCY